MTTAEKIKFVVLRSIGNFLVLMCLYGFGATFGPALYYEAQFHVAQARGIRYTVQEPVVSPEPVQKDVQSSPEKPVTSGLASILTGPKEQVIQPVDPEFSVVIPKIGANARVYPNVDTEDKNIYLPILQKGVAHAKGTVFPGFQGTTYLFAHSTDNWWDVGRYNAIFYLLKDVKAGDDVIVYFENVRYNYVVTDTRIVEATDVFYLTDAQKSTEQKLMLQTCWPPGTTWKRIIVTAMPKGQ